MKTISIHFKSGISLRIAPADEESEKNAIAILDEYLESYPFAKNGATYLNKILRIGNHAVDAREYVGYSIFNEPLPQDQQIELMKKMVNEATRGDEWRDKE